MFKGDLDQVRTVAEQEEPEYEPRADAIRGGAGIVRAMSKVRTMRQAEEAKRIHEERMQPIGEHEEYEWDGLRRRKTVSSGPSVSGSIKRRKTLHPPLGMSRFPDDEDEHDNDNELHPGFLDRIGRKTQTMFGSQSRRRTGRSPVPLDSVSAGPDRPETGDASIQEHTFGLPSGLQSTHGEEEARDTEYKGAAGGSQHVHFAGGVETRERGSSHGSSLAPPQPPPHGQGTRRQFSFQNVFHRKRSDSGEVNRPTSRGAQSYTSINSNKDYPVGSGSGATEEERLGLVHGDSNKALPKYTELVEEPDEQDRESDEWQVTSGTSSSPEQLTLGTSGDLGNQRRKRDPFDDDSDDLYDEPLRSPNTPKDFEGQGGGSRGAFV